MNPAINFMGKKYRPSKWYTSNGRKLPRIITNCSIANSVFLLHILAIKKRAKNKTNRNIIPSSREIEAGMWDCGGYSQRPYRIQ
jgi:hypothetical protein